MTNFYGRALKSQRVKEYVLDARFERTTVISSIRVNGKQTTMMFKGALTGLSFGVYIKEVLSPTLKKDILSF